MLIKTKNLQGKAIQYLGDIEALKKEFPLLTFKEFKSKTEFNGRNIVDLNVSDPTRSEDLIAGDFVLRQNDKWDILSLYEFEKYWVEVC